MSSLPVTKWRHRNPNYVEAEKEVFSEVTRLNHGTEVTVGRCDHANIDLDRSIRSHPFNGLFADGTEELDLRVMIDFADLIKKEGAPMGKLEAADAFPACACERTSFMPEKLGFKKLWRESRAMDGDEFGFWATAEIVNGTRGEFFTCSTFAIDEGL